MPDVTAPMPAAQPSVYDATPAISTATGVGALTRPAGTALHVLADPVYLHVRRSLRGTCTREEWDHPAYRKLAIARAWEKAVAALRAEGEELVSFSPVTLYRAADGRVLLADISLPGDAAPRYVLADGTRVMGRPADLALAAPVVERTTYARWAEGPLPKIDFEMQAAPTPDEDRDIQYLRHQNRALRDLIDGSLGPAEWAPRANDAVKPDLGLVDFRIRGVIRRPDYARFESKQTGDTSAVVLDGRAVATADITTQDGLDAVLDA